MADSTLYMSEEEKEHKSHLYENYQRIIFEGASANNAVPSAERTVNVAPAQAPVTQSDNTRRLADNKTVASVRPALFEGLSYRNDALVMDAPAPVASAPMAQVATAPAPVQISEDEEDALPTRRTMEMLHYSAEMQARETQQTTPTAKKGFFASLSLGMKVVLASVFAAVAVAFVLVCVNAAIINSLDAKISTREAEIETLTTQADEIVREIEAIKDPENIRQFAEANGMVR